MQNSQLPPQSRMLGDPAQSHYLTNSMAKDPQFQIYNNYNQGQSAQEEIEIIAETAKLRRLFFLMLLQFLIVIILTYADYFHFSSNFQQDWWWLLIFSLSLLLISIIASFTNHEITSINLILYIVFIANLYLFFSALTAQTNFEQSLMVAFMILGQISAQFLSVLQSRVELYFHQQALYVLAGGLIIFQLFIIYSLVPFFEMIITLVVGVIFGFLLVYSTQSNLSQVQPGSLNASVRIYVDVLKVFLYQNSLMADIFRKEKQIEQY